jgi:hypothetical protein
LWLAYISNFEGVEVPNTRQFGIEENSADCGKIEYKYRIASAEKRKIGNIEEK